MKTLKKIDPMSTAKMAGILGVIWGLLVAVGMLFVGTSLVEYMGRFYTGFGTMMPVVGFAALITLPLGYGIVGFIIAYVSAVVYNILSEKIGGVKIDLK